MEYKCERIKLTNGFCTDAIIGSRKPVHQIRIADKIKILKRLTLYPDALIIKSEFFINAENNKKNQNLLKTNISFLERRYSL